MAQHDTPEHSGRAIMGVRVTPYQSVGLTLSSTGVDGAGALDPVHAQTGDDTSPALAWSGLMEADTFVLVVEDPDAPMERPYVHWMIWDIPGTATSLPVGVDKAAHPREVEGATQGRNTGGEYGWTGMAPPPGHGVHHYHFQLWALPRRLDLPPNTAYEEVVSALKGNAMAFGELVATYEIADGPQPTDTADARAFPTRGNTAS